ncbi:retinoic acid-induced protein 3-like isoform X1 [Acipenser ruthenus]|uniref:retinoic acid-induced protein 3-like isoform X1 n=2 Tax=Acipenser ruthenus TaxID=7906 RepID=UPI0027415277|nr:retinoic acid-induced protein 3-like isoform X1 [Acipenser ruthenus]
MVSAPLKGGASDTVNKASKSLLLQLKERKTVKIQIHLKECYFWWNIKKMLPASSLPLLPLLLLLLLSLLSQPSEVSSNSTPAPGCGAGLDPVYSYLCDTQASWGIVLETVAAAGVVVTLALIITLLGTVPFVSNAKKLGSVAVQLYLLLGTLGLFGLTFAFIIQPDQRTCPTRVFLFGVLFAMCFSALVAHEVRLLGLVRRERTPIGGWAALGIALGLTLVQVVIAVEWQLTVLVRDGNPCFYSQGEFVMLLIYVMFLMALGLVLAVFTFCGTHGKWKKHGCFAFVTLLLSLMIWVVWIVMLTRGNPELGKRPLWDDPVLSIALVSNAWVFLVFFIAPELHFLSRKGKERVWEEPASSLPTLTYKKHGVDNQVYLPDNRGAAESPYATAMPMENLRPKPDFTIPRPQTTASAEHPYSDYYGRHINSPE